jgi:outer membrane protein
MRVQSMTLVGLALMVGVAAAEAQTPVSTTLGTVGTPGGAAFKLGYINSAVILEGAPGAKEASDAFNQYMQTTEAEVQRMGEQLQTLMANFERQQIALSPQAKTQRENEINQRRQEYQTRVEQLEQQASQRQKDLVQPVMDKITAVIEQIRTEGSYAMIFDVAAGSLISADKTLDLTEEVLRRLRAQAPPR